MLEKALCVSQYVEESVLLVSDKEKDDIAIVSSVFLGDGKKDFIKKYDIHITTASGTCRTDTESYRQKLKRSDGFVLVYSIDNTTSYMRMIEYLSDIQRVKRTTAPVVMVGNKSDLKMPTFELQGQQENMIFKDITHFNVSALNNEGITSCFSTCLLSYAMRSVNRSHTEALLVSSTDLFSLQSWNPMLLKLK